MSDTSPSPVTTCNLCGTTRNESLTEHLSEHHMNAMLRIQTDPSTGVSVILYGSGTLTQIHGGPK